MDDDVDMLVVLVVEDNVVVEPRAQGKSQGKGSRREQDARFRLKKHAVPSTRVSKSLRRVPD